MKKLVLWGLLAFAVAATPNLAQVQTDITMTMPGLVVLYYRTEVTFDVDAGTLGGLVNAVPAEGTTSITGLSGNAGVTGNGFDAIDSLTATVSNFWAVRSIGPNNTEVTVSVSDGTLNPVGTGEILIANPLTRLSGAGAFASDVVDFAPTGFGAGSAQLGDVQFDVDLSGVEDSGDYTGGEITIDAVNL